MRELADRSRPSRLLAFIAARSAAPSASEPISAIAGSIPSLEQPSLAQLGAAAGVPRGGAAAGEVGVGNAPGVLVSMLTPAQRPVGAAAGVGVAAGVPPVGAVAGEAGAGVSGDDRKAYSYGTRWNGYLERGAPPMGV